MEEVGIDPEALEEPLGDDRDASGLARLAVDEQRCRRPSRFGG